MKKKEKLKISKIAVCVCAPLLISACSLKKASSATAPTSSAVSTAPADSVIKPATEGETDLNSIYSWSDVQAKFEKAKDEAGDMYYEALEYSDEQKNELVGEIKDLLIEFQEGGTIYQIKDACTLYKDAIILANSSASDASSAYYQIGEFAQASILTIYGGYGEEFDATTAIQDTLNLINNLGI